MGRSGDTNVGPEGEPMYGANQCKEGGCSRARLRAEGQKDMRDRTVALKSRLLFAHTPSTATDRADVPRLVHGSNRGEHSPLTLASRCGSVYPLLRPGGV